MPKAFVYISYSHQDKNVVRNLKDFLGDSGIDVFDDEKVLLGTEWQKSFNEYLLNADVFIPIITENYNKSSYTFRERSLAVFASESRNKPLIIPYVIDDFANVPYDIAGRLYLKATDNQRADFEKIRDAVIECINKREIQEREEIVAQEKVKKSLSEYLNNVFNRLEDNRKYYRNLGLIAYFISALFLLLAVTASYYMTKQRITQVDTAIFVFGSGVVLTCILAALSRMMFILGRSFMVESIRNADRYHAISFGKFYMEAFENVSRQEVKEVLGAWNFDSESNFSKQDAKDIDPNITGFIESLKKTV